MKCSTLLDYNNALTRFTDELIKIKDFAELKEFYIKLGKVSMNFEENIIDALADNKEKNRKLCSKACSFLTSEKKDDADEPIYRGTT